MEPELSEILNTYVAFDLEPFRFPRKDEWALAWETMQFVARLVEVVKPLRVIEFGSGRSTEVISSLAAGLGGRVLSFEHRDRFARQTRATLEKRGLERTAVVMHRRLTLRRYGTIFLPIYSINWKEFEEFSPFDVALVDGPPGYIGREATVYELFPRMALGSWLIADDINRPGERRWLEAWKAAYGDALEVREFPKIGEGAALLRKRADVLPSYPSIAERMKRLWRRGPFETHPKDIET